jgi:hypothetical protein
VLLLIFIWQFYSVNRLFIEFYQTRVEINMNIQVIVIIICLLLVFRVVLIVDYLFKILAVTGTTYPFMESCSYYLEYVQFIKYWKYSFIG